MCHYQAISTIRRVRKYQVYVCLRLSLLRFFSDNIKLTFPCIIATRQHYSMRTEQQ